MFTGTFRAQAISHPFQRSIERRLRFLGSRFLRRVSAGFRQPRYSYGCSARSTLNTGPPFEHLLHDAKVDPATILALRHCQITDRETFAALDDTVVGLKTVALDIWIDLTKKRMPHKSEFARITTAWNKARAQADIKVTTEALLCQHDEPVAMLPEDWTSVVVQFKKKYGSDLQEEEPPAQAYSRGLPGAPVSSYAPSGVLGSSDQPRWSRGTGTSKAGPADGTRAQPEEHRRVACQVPGHE